MKKILLILLTTLSFAVYGQQFSFQMFFTDAIGNKDTITLGYDLTATDSIDASFGEVNIISVPLDTNLDVRITNEWFNSSSPIYFHTKKQIIFYNCTYTNWSIQAINIFTHHWPVTVEWDSSLFNDTCRNGSVFTSINPGGWWDTSSPSDLWRTELFYSSSPKTFTSNLNLPMFGYINNSGDSIPVFWQAFADSSLLLVWINELTTNSVTIFPNPVTDKLSVTINNNELSEIILYDITSRKLLQQKFTNSVSLNTSLLAKGIYIYEVRNNPDSHWDGVIKKGKIVKE